MPKTKWATYSATARSAIATGGNVCRRHLKFKTKQFICLNERKKETDNNNKHGLGNEKTNQSDRKPDCFTVKWVDWEYLAKIQNMHMN